MHVFSAQLGCSRYLSASLRAFLNGQGFCPDGNRTGSTPKPDRIQKGVQTYSNDRGGWSGHSLSEELWQRPGIWLQAKGKELPSGDKLSQGKSPQDGGALALGQLGMTTFGEIPGWAGVEV